MGRGARRTGAQGRLTCLSPKPGRAQNPLFLGRPQSGLSRSSADWARPTHGKEETLLYSASADSDVTPKKKRFHHSIRAGVGPNPWVPRPGPAEPRSCGPLVTEAPTAPPHAVLALTVRALGTLAGSPRASGRPAFGLSPSSCRWPNPHTLALSSVTGPANGSSPTRGGRRAPAAGWDGVVGHLGTCPCDWI